MKKAAFHSLGCKVNSYETDAMIRLFSQAGYEIVPFAEKADVYVINTCTVTNIADRKSRQMLHRAKEKNPQAVVVAAGCYAQADAARLAADAQVDLVLGNDRKSHVVELVEAYRGRTEGAAAAAPCADVLDIGKKREYEELTVETAATHTRACIKIQDGCNQFCSYCLIPYVRGRVRSRRLADIRAEAERFAENGFRELVLTGIHISAYGTDFPKGEQATLLDVVRTIHEAEGVTRIRLGSLDPGVLDEETIRALAALPKVCPHFHLSLQSGCDSVLARMNRHYTTQACADVCRLLRTYFDDPAITADVIVGFPQETEEEFAQTRRFLETLSLYELHVFKYSRRKGTAADRMPGQLTDAVKTARSHVLLSLSAQDARAFCERRLGQAVEVLFEEPEQTPVGRCFAGHSRTYIRVLARTDADLTGACLPVKITEVDENGLVFGQICTQNLHENADIRGCFFAANSLK